MKKLAIATLLLMSSVAFAQGDFRKLDDLLRSPQYSGDENRTGDITKKVLVNCLRSESFEAENYEVCQELYSRYDDALTEAGF